MNRIIEIGKPYVEKVFSSINESGVRLCAQIKMENPNTGNWENKVLYYEFESKYEKFLCPERSDAFVSGLLTTAMENGADIHFETPISEQLYYQLTSSYIPMLAKYNAPWLCNISLNGPKDNQKIESLKAVATGCSGGVDSFYTIMRHGSDHMIPSHRLTHIVFASCGTLDNNESRIENYYAKYYPKMQSLASELGCEAIGCYTNLHEFYRFPYEGFSKLYTTIYGSVVYAIQKLISVYYVNAGDPITWFNLDLRKVGGHDSSVFDVFTVSCMNTENLNFYASGSECTRLEKEAYIADNRIVQKWLAVCGKETSGGPAGEFANCGVCAKCLRTMVQLYVLGKLDSFGDVFDLKEFYAHKDKYIAKMLGTNKSSYVHDTLAQARVSGIHFGVKVYLLEYFWFKPYKALSHLLNKNLLARKIYYRLGLDYKIHGYRDAKYNAYKDKI